ncbi:cache domain-containing sensor histidine kinase [Paenibacillus silagei]|uniref:Two-component system sensor histidine kinase YesM n=1 Tax=Paenibacillus silagei TaxID=1670801 RepID=A0ABS4NPL4_9BACL|nr:sensor histidine kinase [Paenibacillus silagei]MBP2112007.1 two-component system sensor histidine kinase YesM [Paenibacillus silagei]
MSNKLILRWLSLRPVSGLFTRIPVRNKIVIIIVLLILLPMTFAGCYFYWNISQILTRNANANLSLLIRQTNDNIEKSFQIIDNTSLHFLSNKMLRNWLIDDMSLSDDFYKKFVNKTEMEEDLKYSLMFNNAWNISLLSTAFVFFDSDNYVSVLKTPPNIEQTNKNNLAVYQSVNGRMVRGKEILKPSPGDPTIYFTRVMSNINLPRQRLVLIFGTNEADLAEEYSGLLDFTGAMAYIIDSRGTIYSSAGKQELGSVVSPDILALKDNTDVSEVKLGQETYLAASRSIGTTGLTFIAGIPKKQVLSRLSGSMHNYIWIITLIAFVSLAAGIVISLRFTRVVRDLLRNIRKVQKGNYNTRMPAYKDAELNQLSATFNNMTDEINYLIKEVYEKHLLIKESEIKFLQAQMNPHFLFNTLITIGYKAKLSRDETVYRMVSSLTELLQASIYSNSLAKIPIRQELDFIQFYLYLQKERFEDKLEYTIQIEDDALLDLLLPKLSVQPLVENAVVHGVEKKLGKGMIHIHIYRRNDSVFFDITDNGNGFDQIPQDWNNYENLTIRKQGHNNIGLINTHKRTKLIYGEPYGIEVESEPGAGSRVTLHIPTDLGE